MKKLFIIEDLGERGYLVENEKKNRQTRVSNSQLIEVMKKFDLINELEDVVKLTGVDVEAWQDDGEEGYDVNVTEYYIDHIDITMKENDELSKTYKSETWAYKYYNKLKQIFR